MVFLVWSTARNGFFWFVALLVMVFVGLKWFFLVCSARVLVCNGFLWFVVPKFWFVARFVMVFFGSKWFFVVCSGFGKNTQNHYKPKLWHYKPEETITNQNFGTTNQTKTITK